MGKDEERGGGDFQDIGRSDILRDLGAGDLGAPAKMTDPTPKPEDFRDCPDCGSKTLRAFYWDDTRRRPVQVLLQDPCPYKFTARDAWSRLVIFDRQLATNLGHGLSCPGPSEEGETKPFQQ
jgi:hypothetical protein